MKKKIKISFADDNQASIAAAFKIIATDDQNPTSEDEIDGDQQSASESDDEIDGEQQSVSKSESESVLLFILFLKYEKNPTVL
ncbi:hypothetical protein QYF36_026467 [Acer negundo]|nr:hypothetical protein QYF36_026467 [Acer negundo]